MVNDVTPREDYVGNDAVADFDFDFKIFDQSHLRVIVRDLDDEETELSLGTHYEVSGVGDEDGGTISLVNGAFDWLTTGNLKDDYALAIIYDAPIEQLTDIRNAGAFYQEDIENQFDKTVKLVQVLHMNSQRTVKLADTIPTDDFDPTIPPSIVGVANRVLMTNADGDGLEAGPTAAEIAGASTSAAEAAASASSAADSETAAADSATAAASSAVAAEAAAEAAGTTTVSGTRLAPNSIANAGTISPSNVRKQKIYVTGNGGAITAGTIADGVQDGDELIVVGCSDGNKVTISNGTNTKMNGPVTLMADEMIAFSWDLNDWVEMWRNN